MSSLDTSPIMQLAAEGDASTLQAELRSRALSSLYYFAKVVMNNRDLSSSFHLPKCQELQESIWMKQRGLLWPRAHFKSTILKAYVLWRLVGGGWKHFDYNIPSLDPRNRRWLFVGESDDRVTSAIRNIKWHVENNQMLRWLFPQIIPADVNKTTWRDDAILLPRSMAFDEPAIRGIGVGTKVTGYHGDGFIFDDIIGEKAAKSEADMKAAKEWLDFWPGLVNDWSYVEQIFAGTRWKHDTADVYGALMDEQPFVVNETTGQPSGIKWFVYSALLENDEPAFPERFSKATLAQILTVQKDYKFSCQYLNTPSSPSGADFPPEQLRSYRIEERNGKRDLIVPTDGSAPIRLSQLNRITFLDPSSGGKSAECENAIICLGTAADGRHFVLKAFLKNCGYRAIIEHWHQINDQFVCHSNYYEAVGAQKEIESFISLRQIFLKCTFCEKVHRKLMPIGIKPPGGTMNKDERIRLFLQPTVEENRLYLHEEMFSLRKQVTNFPHMKLKDGIDALAYAVNNARRPSTDEEILEDKEQLTLATALASPRVNTDRQYGGYA